MRINYQIKYGQENGKCHDHSGRVHENSGRGAKLYLFSLTLSIVGVGVQRHTPPAIPAGKQRTHIVKALPHSGSGRMRKNLVTPRFDPQEGQN